MNDVGFSTSLDDICTLLTIKEERGSRGESLPGEITEREIFCSRLKINQSEFYKAHQEGLRSDLCLLVDWQEYEGEEQLKYNNRTYKIYRVYERGDSYIELYCNERAGVSGE